MSEENFYQSQVEQGKVHVPVNGEAHDDDELQGQKLDSKLVDASGLETEIERFEFAPYDHKPEVKYVIWLRMEVLKGSDGSRIRNAVNQLSIDSANLERLRNKLAHMKPDHRVERNEATLREMSVDDDEFTGDETLYWEKREKLRTQIDGWMREYNEIHAKTQDEIDAILAKPNFYQTLREQMFNRVIYDHTIGLPIGPNKQLEKIDFSSPDTRYELSDSFTAKLQKFIDNKLKKKDKSGKTKSGR